VLFDSILPLDTMDLDHSRTVQARSLYANYTLTMVTVGKCQYASVDIQAMLTRTMGVSMHQESTFSWLSMV
jgi:hypothetical protein